MKSQKRVLIINGHSAYENNSTSITIKSIISSFDSNTLLELYYYPINNYSDENCVIKSIQLNSKTKWLYSLIRKVYTGKLKNEINNKIVNSEITNKVSNLHKVKNLLLAINDYLPIYMKYNKKEIELVDQFKPEIIYTLGSAIFPLEVSLFFSNKYNIPIVLHHMDNWRETKYNDSYLLRPCRNKLIKVLNSVESVMNCGMTISEEMADYYSKISKKKYVALMNTVPNLNISSQNKFENNQINIVYAGGLHLDRWKVLLDFENVIKKINREDKVIILHIFTKETDKEKYEKVFNKENTKFHDFMPHNKVFKIYEMADILIHVESFDAELIKFTKYSLSTKIPEYMSAGKPIICYAPKDIAVSKYVNKCNCGLSVSNTDELYNGIKVLLEDDILRKEMSKNGIRISAEKHSEEYKDKIIKEVLDY
ncbi:glycosyltransferase [Pelosinus sp. UFO1]|uniref:glycosyltransferase n=1 Tax=Pelosinus sp. UFO1 TaxID=484770 RepID=UPI0004D10BD2|nr:glycosyltransferase [Pelosinus sp. UFO1]AIF53697.1 hypothetical protein UFO1_4154 [Pelosinus sp. UFO1]